MAKTIAKYSKIEVRGDNERNVSMCSQESVPDTYRFVEMNQCAKETELLA